MSRVAGIIAEYNPFHNGHYYHIQRTKELTGTENIVAVISGNFTQRGEPSIVNKWSKAYMAICGGADLVIELPTIYAVSSAENFASGAIKILNELKIVDELSFGAESKELSTLNNIANVLCDEPKQYLTILSHELSKGISYPKARENAILMYLNDIKRYGIKSIDELNVFFNDFYCNYLNEKYAYEPKENETAFVPLVNTDLSNILCIRDTRTILNGNMFSWKNNYYQILDQDNSIKLIYKGTEIQVFENVLTKKVKVKYYNIFYETKKIEGHRQDPVKREQMRIDNQKQLEQVLKERDERLKARANKVSS